MIGLNTSGAEAEILFFLPQSADPANGKTGHGFVLGEVEYKLPGGVWTDVPLGQIVERGFGWYAIRLTSGETAVAGEVAYVAVCAGAQPDRGTELISDLGGELALGSAGSLPFYLPDVNDPIGGPPVSGHGFVLGEVKLSLPGGAFVDVDPLDIVEHGDGIYAVLLSAAQTANRGKAIVYANVAGAQKAGNNRTILNAGTVGVPTVSPAAALSSVESLQGGIGIFGDFRTRDDQAGDLITTWLRFREEGDSPTRDDARGLDDTYAPVGTVLPGKVAGIIGPAAVFDDAPAAAYEAEDRIDGGTLHTRDVTLKAIMSWDVAAQDTYGQAGTIVARGLGASASEYMPYALELSVVNVATREAQVRFLWQDTTGVLKSQGAATFIAPASGFFMVTATRRWVSPTSVVLRYYLNDRIVAEVASVDGDIGGGVSGHTTIGCRYTGAAYERFLNGAIDELAICNYEVSAEEIEATWARIDLLQTDGYRMMRDLFQPGLPISEEPTSRVQSDLRLMGVGLGFASGLIENFRRNIMPDRAYGEVARRWSRITRSAPKLSDSLDTRRRRTLGQLSTRAGVSIPGARNALRELLDCAANDLEVLAFDNTIVDDFSQLLPERWRHSPEASWSVLGGELRVQAAAGAFPWDGATVDGALSAMIGVEPPRGAGATFSGLHTLGSITPTALPDGAEAGIALWNYPARSMLFVGMRNTAGAYSVGYQLFRDGAAVGAWVSLAAVAAVKHWLRVRPSDDQAGVGATDQKYDLSYSTIGSDEADLTTPAPVTWARHMGWAGFYFRTHATTIAAGDVRFADFKMRNVYGTRPYYWYVYRDPALGGSPDLAGADAVVQRMKHAFTYARVITSLSVLTDSSPVDGGPMGAL